MTQAREFMTKDVITVSPDATIPEIARLLLDSAVSAVPVVDASGVPIGMVSEGDLIGREAGDRDARRDWWLDLLAEGEALAPEFLENLRHDRKTARDIMAAPVVTIDESTEAAEIVDLLQTHRIKRVPVLRDGHIVGIVSRADILRALAATARETASKHPPHSHNPIYESTGGSLQVNEFDFRMIFSR
jgi:CBS domain-containing protein